MVNEPAAPTGLTQKVIPVPGVTPPPAEVPPMTPPIVPPAGSTTPAQPMPIVPGAVAVGSNPPPGHMVIPVGLIEGLFANRNQTAVKPAESTPAEPVGAKEQIANLERKLAAIEAANKEAAATAIRAQAAANIQPLLADLGDGKGFVRDAQRYILESEILGKQINGQPALVRDHTGAYLMQVHKTGPAGPYVDQVPIGVYLQQLAATMPTLVAAGTTMRQSIPARGNMQAGGQTALAGGIDINTVTAAQLRNDPKLALQLERESPGIVQKKIVEDLKARFPQAMQGLR